MKPKLSSRQKRLINETLTAKELFTFKVATVPARKEEFCDCASSKPGDPYETGESQSVIVVAIAVWCDWGSEWKKLMSIVDSRITPTLSWFAFCSECFEREFVPSCHREQRDYWLAQMVAARMMGFSRSRIRTHLPATDLLPTLDEYTDVLLAPFLIEQARHLTAGDRIYARMADPRDRRKPNPETGYEHMPIIYPSEELARAGFWGDNLIV